MNIVILGAGQVGSTIAESLSPDSDIDLCVVDTDQSRLDYLAHKVESINICGSATDPDVLRQANIEDAEMVLAVTGSDEVNVLACQLCYHVFDTPKRLARIRAQGYLKEADFKSQVNEYIDQVINPEQEVTRQCARLVRFPGATQLVDFGGLQPDGTINDNEVTVQLAAIKAAEWSQLVGKNLDEVADDLAGVDARLVAMHALDSTTSYIYPTESPLTIAENDEIYVVAAPRQMQPALRVCGYLSSEPSQFAVAGGGHVGKQLTLELKRRWPRSSIKLIEYDEQRAIDLDRSIQASDVTVLHGDVSDESFLYANNVQENQYFFAVTNDDEINVMSSLLAKSIEVPYAIALVGKPTYVNLVGHTAIDVAISPQQSTASMILRHVHEVSPIQINSMRDGKEQALLVNVSSESHKIVGKDVSSLSLPKSACICALLRDGQLHTRFGGMVVEPNDQLVVFLSDISAMDRIEALIRVSPLSF